MAAKKIRIGGLALSVAVLLFLLLWRACADTSRPALLRAIPAGSPLVLLTADAGRFLADPALFPASFSPSLAADLEALRNLWRQLDSLAPGRSWPLALHYHISGPEGPALGAVFNVKGLAVDPAMLVDGSALRRTEYRGREIFAGRRSGQSLVVARQGTLLLAGRFPFLVEGGIGQLAGTAGTDLPPVATGEDPATIQIFVRQEKLGELFGGPFAGASVFPEGWWRLLVKKEAVGLTWKGRFWAAGAPVSSLWSGKGEAGAILEVIPESPAFLAWTAAVGEPAAVPALLDDAASGEVALVVPVITGNWQQSDRLVVVGLQAAGAAGALETLARRTGVLEQFDYQTFPVRRLLTGLPALPALAGTPYAFQNPYVVQLGDYLVFADSRSALELWVDRQVVSATLARSPAFLEFLAANAGPAGAFFYGDPQSLRLVLADTPPGRWLEDFLAGFLAAGGFAERSGGRTVWGGHWPRDTASTTSSDFLWRRRLDGAIGSAPQVVRWADGPAMVAVSDEGGGFYLLDAQGEVRWTFPLDGPLRSRIELIDYYGNGQEQMLFNTRHSVYLLDREGRSVGAYPLRLQSPALAGLTLAQFSGPGDYGIFIPSANGSIFGFDERQLPLPGWNPGDSLGAPAGSILHFQFDNKDFVVGLGADGILRVYDRSGRLRFVPDTLGAPAVSPPGVEIRGSRAVIAAADRRGGVLLRSPGRSSTRLRLRTQADPMWFAFADVTGDERQDYIALSGRRLTVHAYEGNRLQRKTDQQLDVAPDTLFTVAIPGRQKRAIGTLTARSHQIHLFDGAGRLLPGFPLAGGTAFSVVDLFGDGRRVVLVGEGDSVYVYVVRGE